MTNSILFRGMYLVKLQGKARGLLNRKCRNHHLYKENRYELRTTENFPTIGNCFIFKSRCKLQLCFKLYLYTTCSPECIKYSTDFFKNP